jgi:hypothetical protein
VDRLWQARLIAKFGLSAAMGGALIPGCNAVSGINDYKFDRACAQSIVAVAEDCSTDDIDDNCDGVAPCSADSLWAKGFGKSAQQQGRAVAFDHARNILVAGTFDGEVDLAGGADILATQQGTDIFLAKFDPAGKPLWHKQFGGSGAQEVSSIAVDSQDNVLLVGSFSGEITFGGTAVPSSGQRDILVAKISAGGDVVWSKTFGDGGGGDQIAAAVAADAENNVIFTGSFTGSLDFGVGADQLTSVGGYDVFFAKLDPNGDHRSSNRFGDVLLEKVDQIGSAIAVGPGGAFFLGGWFRASLVTTEEGTITSASANDAFVIAIAADGSVQWARSFGDAQGSAATQQVTSMATDPDGNLIIAGRFEGEVSFSPDMSFPSKGGGDMFLAKLDPSGALVWSAAYGTSAEDVANAVATDGARNVLLTGSVLGPVDFGADLKSGDAIPTHDLFLAKFNGAGDAITTPRFAAAGPQQGRAIAADALGNIAITGFYIGTVTLDPEVKFVSISPVTDPLGYTDAFLAVFRP